MFDIYYMNEKRLKKINQYNSTYSQATINQLNKKNIQKRQSIKNKPFYTAYYNIIHRLTIILKRLGIQDPITTSVIFEYLLWNGYFSINHQLAFSIEGRVNNLALAGADIMRGKSVCLNNTFMLTDLLQCLGIKAYTFGCNLLSTPETTEIEYRPAIERKHIPSKENIIDKILSKLVGATIQSNMGNHAVTIFEMNNSLYLEDPTNLAFLNITDFLKARYVGSKEEIDIKPWLSIMQTKLTKNELDHLVFRSLIPNTQNPLTIDLIRQKSEQSLQICHEYEDLLERYHQACQKDIKTVCKTLTKK